MTTPELTALAEHIATHYGLEVEPRYRDDIDVGDEDFIPLRASAILDEYAYLAGLADDPAAPNEFEICAILPTVTDDGGEQLVDLETMTPEECLNALVTAAAEYAAIKRRALVTMLNFTALLRIARANGLAVPGAPPS